MKDSFRALLHWALHFGAAVLSTAVFAQPLERPKFEVASVKVSAEQGGMAVRDTPGGRLVANAPIKLLIMNAFGIQRSEIVGGPDWINRDRYQIEAKGESSSDRNQLMQMLQTLLQERFRMTTHREIRETPAFSLTVGKRGSKLAPRDNDCAADMSASSGRSGTETFPCGQMRISGSAAGVIMEGKQVPISELVRVLAVSLGRPVLNGTNLSGVFDIRLEFAEEGLGAPSSESAGAVVFAALQEQLGLKLELAKTKISFLIIDQIERPTEN
jgi:uncharacterized protein (TIGR03435 family)